MILTLATLAGCSSSGVAPAPTPTPASTACTPAPIPSPQITLVSPSSGAAGVLPNTASISVMTGDFLVTEIDITPAVDGTTALTNVAASGSASPTGEQTYAATLPGMLAAHTNYTIAAKATFDPTGCPQQFTVSVGSFST